MTTQTIEQSSNSDQIQRVPRVARNGVDVPTLFQTIDVVRGQRELAAFKFRVRNQWLEGTHSRSVVQSFTGAGGDHEHLSSHSVDGDHPMPLVGTDRGATPVELLLSALASCLTAGIANIAAARGVNLHSVESNLTGDIDVSGLLGLDDSVRNGFQNIEVNFKVRGDASAEKLQAIVDQSRARSAVFDIITSGVPVKINVDAA